MLEAPLGQDLRFRAIPVGWLPASVGRAALERGLVMAGEMIRDVRRRESHAAGYELQRARFRAGEGLAVLAGFAAFADLAGFAAFADLAGFAAFAGFSGGGAETGDGAPAHILISFAASFGPSPSSSCLMKTYASVHGCSP